MTSVVQQQKDIDDHVCRGVHQIDGYLSTLEIYDTTTIEECEEAMDDVQETKRKFSDRIGEDEDASKRRRTTRTAKKVEMEERMHKEKNDDAHIQGTSKGPQGLNATEFAREFGDWMAGLWQ